jgi:hypothetical protein
MLRNEKKGEAEEREVEEDSNAFSNAEFLRSQVILSLSLSHTYTHTHIHTHTHTQAHFL